MGEGSPSPARQFRIIPPRLLLFLPGRHLQHLARAHGGARHTRRRTSNVVFQNAHSISPCISSSSSNRSRCAHAHRPRRAHPFSHSCQAVCAGPAPGTQRSKVALVDSSKHPLVPTHEANRQRNPLVTPRAGTCRNRGLRARPFNTRPPSRSRLCSCSISLKCTNQLPPLSETHIPTPQRCRPRRSSSPWSSTIPHARACTWSSRTYHTVTGVVRSTSKRPSWMANVCARAQPVLGC